MTDARAPACSTAPRHGAAEISQEIKFSHGGARPGAGRPRSPPANPWAETNSWTGPRWCVYQTHPQAELLAAVELSRSGYHCYAPQIAMLRRDRVILTMFHKVLVPRFPGYGFVELATTDPWVPVRYAAGVRGVLLACNGRPALVPVGEVERHMAEDGALCDLSPEVMPCFDVGTRVRIEAGAMESFRGTVVECDGVVTMVEVTMFGRLVQARLARTTLAAA